MSKWVEVSGTYQLVVNNVHRAKISKPYKESKFWWVEINLNPECRIHELTEFLVPDDREIVAIKKLCERILSMTGSIKGDQDED